MVNLTNRFKYDLIIGFGFSGANADEAISRYKNGDLSEDEMYLFGRLIKNSPFKLYADKYERTLPDSQISILNNLNYRISDG